MLEQSKKVAAQRGFFDAGLSLLILALSGTAVYLIEEDQHDRLEIAASQQPQAAQVLPAESAE